MNLRHILLALSLPVILFSCVPTRKFKASEAKYNALSSQYADLQSKLQDCQRTMRDSTEAYNRRSNVNEERVEGLKQNNSVLLNQLKDLSVITGSQAESIKKSLDNIGAKDAY